MPLLPYNTVPTRSERTYMTTETTFGTYVAATNTSACRSIRCSLTPQIPMLTRRDKTGSLSQTVGIKGRIYGTWEIEMDLTGNGTAGNKPDSDILFAGAFGQAGSAVSSTWVYALSDASYTFDLWSFRNINGASTTNLEQRVAGSCVVTQLEISYGGDFSVLTARGDCLCILDSNYFSSASTPEKGGLMTFPTEPSAPVTNGYPSPGFVGTATFDSLVIPEIKTGNVVINTGRRLIRDSFGSYVPTGIEAAERTIMMSFTTDDSDDANLADLKTKSKTKVVIPYSLQIGTVAGSIFTISGANWILNPPSLEDTAIRYQARFPQSQCYASTYTAKDEISIVAS